MIKLTMLNDADVIVNADLIEYVERMPDTLLTLSTGRKIIVREPVEDVLRKVVTYKRLVAQGHRIFGSRTRRTMGKFAKEMGRWTLRQ